MVCCCGADAEEDEVHAPIGNPGPDIQRGCTDVFCLVFMALSIALSLTMLHYLRDNSTTDILTHGHDHYHNMCGIEPKDAGYSDVASWNTFKQQIIKKRYVYYPDLQADFEKDPTLSTHYGVCVDECPAQGTTIADYKNFEKFSDVVPSRRDHWFVSLPSFAVGGRCVPYKPSARSAGETDMCAYPACDLISNGDKPTKPNQVCGLERDQTKAFWLLSEPDVTLTEGWKAEGASEAVIQARKAQTALVGEEMKKTCEVSVRRGLSIAMMPKDDEFLLQVLARYTGVIFRSGNSVYLQSKTIFSIGIGGSLIASFLVIVLMTCFAKCVVLLLLFLLFTVLSVADYILFYMAGVASGESGLKIIAAFEDATQLEATVPDALQKMLDQAGSDQEMEQYYKYAAIILAVVIVLLLFAVCALWKNFEMLIALLKEASRTIQEMPSLLVFPFILVCSMLVTFMLFLTILLGVATTDPVAVAPLLEVWIKWAEPVLKAVDLQGENSFKQMQQAFIWIGIFQFLWAYFFHVAMFTSIVAISVANWYFYRDDPERNAGTGIHSAGWFPGRPIILSTYRLCRYHLGSMAYGSFIMAAVTMPRIVLEYINSTTDTDSNQVTKAIVWALRCCLWCLESCLQFLTEYAYVYVAVTGKPFCSSARASFGLFAKYPAQVALDKMACGAMRYLACVTVPAGMAVLSYPFIKVDWVPCAVFIFGLAYVVTRLTVGVYDVCVTTLFVCAMRDTEHYGGKYMSDGLRAACGFAPKGDQAREVSMEMPASGKVKRRIGAQGKAQPREDPPNANSWLSPIVKATNPCRRG